MIAKVSILKMSIGKNSIDWEFRLWSMESIELTAFMHNEWLIIDMNLGVVKNCWQLVQIKLIILLEYCTSTFFIHVYIKNPAVVYLQLGFLPQVYSNLPATESTHYLAVQVNGLSVQQDQVTLINILINIQHWSPTTAINLCPLCTGEHNYYLPLYILLFGTELFHTMCVDQD